MPPFQVKRDRLYRIDIRDDGTLAFDNQPVRLDREGWPVKRVTILVTHLLGTGHLSRSLILARALRDAGMQPQLISGGMPTGHLDISGIDFVQLPPVRSDGAGFTRLLDREGNPHTPALMQERTQAIVVRPWPHASDRPDHRTVSLRPPHAARRNSRQR